MEQLSGGHLWYNIFFVSMSEWKNIAEAVNSSLRNKSWQAAQEQIISGLKKYPKHPRLIAVAANVYLKSNDLQQSLEYSKLLINLYPDQLKGYLLTAKSLVFLKRFEEAKVTVEAGLKRLPGEITLKKYLNYINQYLGIRTFEISDCEANALQLNYEDLIAYSSAKDFFKILQSHRVPCVDNCSSLKKYIFVAGLGRSGTTALGNLLNLSFVIEMYTEIYSPFRLEGYSRSDFSYERIHQISHEHPSGKEIEKMLSRHSHSILIGDKRPYFEFCAESTFDNIGGENFKCIYSDRHLVDICMSSHKRSVALNDRWSVEKGIEHTILLFNASCRQVLYLYDNRPEIFSAFRFVSYETIFGSVAPALELFNFCGLRLLEDEHLALSNFIDVSKPYSRKSFDESNPLVTTIKECIMRLLDFQAYDRFCAVTGNKRCYRF